MRDSSGFSKRPHREGSIWEAVVLGLLFAAGLSAAAALLVFFTWQPSRGIQQWTTVSIWSLLFFLNVACWSRLVTSSELTREEKRMLAGTLLFVTVCGALGTPVVLAALSG